MNVRFVRTGVAVIALILAVTSLALAEPNKSNSVNIKFKFIVGGKLMEPGTYAVDVAENGNVTLTPEKGSPVELAQVKNLGKKKVSKLELVFEEAGVHHVPGGSVDAGEGGDEGGQRGRGGAAPDGEPEEHQVAAATSRGLVRPAPQAAFLR